MTDSLNVSVSLSVSGQLPAAAPSSASTQRTGDGRVQFENDNYRITAGDNDEVIIFNKATGENYRIWGDPHVEIDGKHAFDFWGQTTFVLDDGTRLTIATTPWDAGNNGASAPFIAANSGASDAKYGELQKKSAEFVKSAKSITQFMDRDTRPDFASTVMIPAIQSFIKNPKDIDGLCTSIQAQKKSIFGS